jgi:hypothetical protein
MASPTDLDIDYIEGMIQFAAHMREFLRHAARNGNARDCVRIRKMVEKEKIEIARDLDILGAIYQAHAGGHMDTENFLIAWLRDLYHT